MPLAQHSLSCRWRAILAFGSRTKPRKPASRIWATTIQRAPGFGTWAKQRELVVAIMEQSTGGTTASARGSMAAAIRAVALDPPVARGLVEDYLKSREGGQGRRGQGK